MPAASGQVWRLHGIVGHGGPGSTGARNKYFFDWLTDPVKNGAGALMDFGCYNALWSLWYLGRPESVYAQVNHLRPETFPKVEDNSDMILHYKNAVGHLRRKLGPAAQLSGPGSLRPRRQRLHEERQGGAAQGQRRGSAGA